MLTRLAAEERLNAINDHSVALGHVGKHDRGKMIAGLEAARDGVRPGARRAKAVRAKPTDLAALGIGYRVVPPSAGKEEVGDG